MNNAEIRNAAGGCGLRLWQVAEALGMNDSAFSRKLRRELPAKEKERILNVIEKIAAKQRGVD